MIKKLVVRNIAFFWAVFGILLLASNAASQIIDEKPITCEYFKVVLDTLIGKSENTLIPTDSGSKPYTIFVISPGNRKSSNVRIARKLEKELEALLKTGRYKSLRYVIVTTEQRKGFGHMQIYFLDQVQDFTFGENLFYCP